jgi:hypothetical protein
MNEFIDYKILVDKGNVGFYNSCEVTQLFLHRKNDKANFNFFIIAVFEEKPFIKTNHKFLCKPIFVNDEINIGIQRYFLSMDEIEANFTSLLKENIWSFNGDKSLQFPKLKSLSKQYIPTTEGNRINQILKNNFHSGSYILEFFDEEKTNFNFFPKKNSLKKLDEISEKIKDILPIDISVVADRIGNIIFQFPISILELNPKALSTWNGVELNFTWHNKIINPPECLLQVESTIDTNYMGSKIDDYNKTHKQEIIIGSLDQINHVKIWRKSPNLIISNFDGTYIRGFQFDMNQINSQPRIFERKSEIINVQISSRENRQKNNEKPTYRTFIQNEVEKKRLEKSLTFKQYRNNTNDALSDLRGLIEKKDENGVYLWDPFLTSEDILNTLFYSTTSGVNLRAIGSISKKVRYIYSDKKHTSKIDELIKCIKNLFSKKKNNQKKWKVYLEKNKKILDNPKHNNYGLNLEFRIQHSNFGWAFHDRFLIFPGGKLKRPQVYSLGASINSYGENHHILQEVSHPQPVIDAFIELWDELNKPECLVWKFPK